MDTTDKYIDVDYDEESDVLYISLGKPRPGIVLEDDNGRLIRIDPKTNEMIGITLLDLKEHYALTSIEDIQEVAKNIVQETANNFFSINKS